MSLKERLCKAVWDIIQEKEEQGGIVENSYKEVELRFIYEDGNWKVDDLNISS